LSSAVDTLSIAIGGGDRSTINEVVMSGARASALLAIAVGTASQASAGGASSFGWGSTASALDSSAFGSNAQANAANSIAIGGYGFPGVGKGTFVASDATAPWSLARGLPLAPGPFMPQLLVPALRL